MGQGQSKPEPNQGDYGSEEAPVPDAFEVEQSDDETTGVEEEDERHASQSDNTTSENATAAPPPAQPQSTITYASMMGYASNAHVQYMHGRMNELAPLGQGAPTRGRGRSSSRRSRGSNRGRAVAGPSQQTRGTGTRRDAADAADPQGVNGRGGTRGQARGRNGGIRGQARGRNGGSTLRSCFRGARAAQTGRVLGGAWNEEGAPIRRRVRIQEPPSDGSDEEQFDDAPDEEQFDDAPYESNEEHFDDARDAIRDMRRREGRLSDRPQHHPQPVDHEDNTADAPRRSSRVRKPAKRHGE